MRRIPVEVTGITVCPPYQGYLLILHETEGARYLPIFIGHIEAQNISQILKSGKMLRPMTFDLVHNLLDASAVRVEEIVITELRDQTFFAEVILRLPSGGVRQVDARPSDAIALALRMRAPIFVFEKVMQDAAESADQIVRQDDDARLKELQQKLQEAVDQEAYEEAAKLRDEIRTLDPQVAAGND